MSSKAQRSNPTGANPTFKTEPTIASPQPRSVSYNPKQTYSNQPMYKAHNLGKPPSLARHPDATPIENPYYRDPPIKLDEGINRRLYEEDGRSRYWSPQRHSKPQIADAFDQSHLRRTNQIPQYQERPSYDEYPAEPKFPNTPFKQNIPREMDYVPNTYSYESSPIRNSPTQYYQNSLPPIQQANGYSQSPYPNRDASPPMVRKYEEAPQQPSLQELNRMNEEYEKYEEEIRRKKELSGSYTPSYTNFRETIRAPKARLPTLDESAKMRNPMFASYDFAGYDKSLANTSQRFRPGGFNYNSNEPVNAKEFLKSHVSTIAQAKRYDMEQITKIHPQLGLVAKDERTSTPILKPYAVENENLRSTFRSTKGLRQPIDSSRYDVNPLRSNVGFSVNPQHSYHVQPTEVASARQKYSNSFFQDEKGQNRNGPYQGNYGVLEKQSTTASMFSPSSLKLGNIEGRYERQNGQHAASYRPQVGYPW